jgi:hypothetical protein
VTGKTSRLFFYGVNHGHKSWPRGHIFQGIDPSAHVSTGDRRAGRESEGARRWAQAGRLRRARASWKGCVALRQRARSSEFLGVGCTAARPSTPPAAGTGGARRVEAGPRRAARRARVVSTVYSLPAGSQRWHINTTCACAEGTVCPSKYSKPTALGCSEASASLGCVRLAPQVLAGISSAPACRCLSRHRARCRGNRHGTVLKSERRSRQRKEVRGAGSRGTLFRWCLVRYCASHCGPLEEPFSCSGAL